MELVVPRLRLGFRLGELGWIVVVDVDGLGVLFKQEGQYGRTEAHEAHFGYCKLK